MRHQPSPSHPHHQGLGGSRWHGRLFFGFPINGPHSQRFRFPGDGKAANRIPPVYRYANSPARFRERAAKLGHKNAQIPRDDSLDQAGEGRLIPPTPSAAAGVPISWRPISINFFQADKLRAGG